ncbi:class I SAM-dependent methyltransferase [Acetivibrio cellulolyticus]|uniref:class I SAM-dependent methyltransferase n=1 Tax=Acetivibrio cellulolyticus TaxID=35830 RepID=UPI0001E2E2F1|nr:class I SAM-dependent methyltransferase [Acetivibrio cellulolyticus]
MNCKCVPETRQNRKKYIEAYYKPNMGKGLPDFKVLGWESKEAQDMRFETLRANVDLKNKKVLDVGCGLGNLLEYLNSNGINVEYTGVDIIEDMIESVKQKNLIGEFYCMDIFKQHHFESRSFDVIYTSGIFNLNMGNNMEFLMRALGCFINLSKSIIAFNLLDKNSPGKEDIYYYYDPEEVAAMMERQYPQIKNIKIVRGYLNNDFTIISRKVDFA